MHPLPLLLAQAADPPASPLRLAAAGLIAFALVLLSGLLWSSFLKLIRYGEPVLETVPRPEWPLHAPLLWLALVAWAVVPVFVASLFGLRPLPPDAPLADQVERVRASAASQTLVLAIILGLLTLRGRSTLRAVGIHLRHWPRQAALGAIVFVASLVPVLIVLLLTAPLRTEETQHSFLKLLRTHPSWDAYFWITLSAVLLAPLVEELVFRVLLQGSLQSVIAPRRAIPAVAVLFCLVHGFPDSLALFPLAIILGYTYYKTNSYLTIATAHSCFNAFNLLMTALLTP